MSNPVEIAVPVEIRVEVPSLLQASTGGLREVQVEAASLEGLFESLFAKYPLLRRHLLDEKGQVRPHVNLFLNDTDIRWLENWQEPLQGGDRLTVLQAVSGG